MIPTKVIVRALLAAGIVAGGLGLAMRAIRPAPRSMAKVTLSSVEAPARAPAGPTMVIARPGPAVEQVPAPAVDPLAPRDAGYRVIANLQNTGAYDAAARYAAVGPEAFRRDLLIAAYHEWSRREPAAALASALGLPDAVARETAVQSVWSGWARADPVGLAETALDFPEGEDRDAALTKAIRAWMISDPWKAGDWVLAHKSALAAADTVFRTEQR